jgi:hypothetical protein
VGNWGVLDRQDHHGQTIDATARRLKARQV